MTGNIVLLGLAAGTSDAGLAESTGFAFAGYAAGVLLGATVARHTERALRAGLPVQLALLSGFTAVWEITSARPAGALRWTDLVLASTAMGMQSSLVMSLGMPRLSTTYMTSTLTRLLFGAVGGHGRTQVDWAAASRLLALGTGAVLAALLVGTAAQFAPALSLAGVAAAWLSVWVMPAHERRPHG